MVYVFRKKESITANDKIMLLITVVAVVIAVANKINWTQFIGPAILLAICAAVVNGLYAAISEIWKDKGIDPLILIFIVEIMTAIMITPIALMDNFSLPNSTTLFYLFIIGAFANGVAFWLQLEGFQIAARLEDTSHKIVFLVFQVGVVTLAQVIILSISGAEKLNSEIWIAVLVLVVGLVWYRLPTKNKG
jgi:drug/metabolite transporter (DMT)-like permease